MDYKRYHITVTARITKTYEVDAMDAQEAEEIAHAMFSTEKDNIQEKYEQETQAVTLNKGDDFLWLS